MEPAAKKLTIGMATYDDYNGVYFTVKALQIYHPHIVNQSEILIVDNNPDSLQGKAIKEFVNKFKRLAIRYVPYKERIGTSAAREQVVQNATTDWVLVCDCHVFFEIGALDSLLEYIEKHNPVDTLIQGVILNEDGEYGYTHYLPKWRGGLYGIWAPVVPRSVLETMEPMEILGTGLGVFVCNKNFWPGFHPHHKGFGGEEIYIHEKYRQKGGQCILLPSLRYYHRFGYKFLGRHPYLDSYYHRARNYVLEFMELGWDIETVREYYVGHGYITPKDWEHLIADPINHDTHPGHIAPDEKPKTVPAASIPQSDKAPVPTETSISPQDQRRIQLEQQIKAVQQLAEEIVKTQDLDEVLQKYGTRKEKVPFNDLNLQKTLIISADALDLPLQLLFHAPAQSLFVVLSNRMTDMIILDALMKKVAGYMDLRHSNYPLLEIYQPADDCTLLAIDLTNQDESLLSFLEKFVPRTQQVLFYNIERNPEITDKLSTFMLNKFPNFAVREAESHLYILFDRNGPNLSLPTIFTRLLTYSKSIGKRLTGESQRVPDEEVQRRLSICGRCEYRRGTKCTICGCYLINGLANDGKVFWSAEKCPKDKW